MKSPEFFQEKKNKWVDQWFEAVIETYPSESARFFKDTRDPFANPVGATLKNGIVSLYDLLVAGEFDPEAARQAIEPMIRLRAVQEFTPGNAIGYLFEIKKILTTGTRKASSSEKNQAGEKNLEADLVEIRSRVDAVMLIAFDIYLEDKKRIYQLRATQARDNVRQLLIKKGLISELPDIDPELGA